MERKHGFQQGPATTGLETFWRGRAARAQQDSAQPAASRAAGAAAFPIPRLSLRRRIPIEAVINFGLTYSSVQHVRDLSTNGAFVEMGDAVLTEGTPVEFVLRYKYKDQPVELRLPATVARVVPGGAALHFGSYDDAAYTHLVNLLYAM